MESKLPFEINGIKVYAENDHKKVHIKYPVQCGSGQVFFSKYYEYTEANIVRLIEEAMTNADKMHQ